MDTIFTLPLSVLATLEILLALLLLSPRAISLPIAQVISKARRAAVAQSVFYTVCILLSIIFASGFLEVMRGAKRADGTDVRGDMSAMATIDFLRAQLSCVLCVLNIVLILIIPSLAESLRQLDSQMKNQDAMRRQVKGLQAEYERVTAKPSSGAPEAPGPSELDSWKAKVDRLIREKAEQQDAVDAAVKAQAQAEARVEAMLNQIKGFDKEYDRVLDENRQLQRKVGQSEGTYKENSKKDE